jgi:hypothetical protein
MFPKHTTRMASRAAVLALFASASVAAPALAKPPAAKPAAAPAAAAPAAAAPAPATAQSLTSEITTALGQETTSTDTSGCAAPTLTQPFLAWQDQNEYALAPGESADSFAGTGWTLGDGASIKTETLADGSTGPVLDLPSGGYAISPPMCVDNDYPTARTMVATTGNAQVGAGVFYAADKANQQLQLSGVMQGSGSSFSLSQPLQVHPGNLAGWQLVQFVFGATGSSSDGQIYNFYVDPRMCR